MAPPVQTAGFAGAVADSDVVPGDGAQTSADLLSKLAAARRVPPSPPRARTADTTVEVSTGADGNDNIRLCKQRDYVPLADRVEPGVVTLVKTTAEKLAFARDDAGVIIDGTASATSGGWT